MTTSSRFIEFSEDELERSVPERFEQQASLYAHRTAVKTKGRQITYRELNESANQIARILCRRSSPDRAVALLLDHDFPAVTSILGVLKSGRSFVPLDPSLPSARLNYMLEDSGAGVIVTNNQRVALANELFRSSTINIDQIEIAETGNLELSISPGSMSCILYTSGITGLPKGVVHTHRNELHNVMHHTNTLLIGANDRLTLLGSYSTGQGMQDLYCALLNGATVYPWNLKVDGLSHLADWLIKEKVTIYHSAATVFRSWIRTFTGQEEFPDLRILRLGSEHVFWKDVEAYKRHFSAKCVFINALSSSETKTICQYLVNKKTHITARVPVGYAVAGTEILVVDELGNPLEPDSAGEIAVRSRFISPLYWRDANSTNTAQVPNLSNPEKRLFRTGEWGRMSVDGCLEHLGRRDAQVKIRGYRIEIFEAEIAILSHPSVDEVIVLCRENKRGDKYLVAYIRANGSLVPTVDELRTFLRRKIPEYMIPSAFVFLKSFPLTHNGKVNRDALPSPDSARPLLGNAFVAPTSPVEYALAEISTEVLDIDEIGVHDNHFDLGGNSLTAIQLVASVERQFGVMLSLQQFFDSPTIAALSRTIMATLGSTVPLDDLRIELAPRDDLLPLSFAQQRLWFLDQWEPGSPVYNICRAYRLRGKLEVRALQESFSAILRRHEVLRTCFPAIDGQARQVIASFVPVSMSIVNLSDLLQNRREEKSLQIAVEDAEQPFDLAKGPVVRAKLVRLADDEHLFVLTVHQIACDGWSMQILERELWTIYDAVTREISPTLPPLALQYADFATWQKQKMRDLAPQAQITYWKNRLHEPWPLLNLPTDRPRSGHQSFRGLRESLALTEVLTGRVKELARKEEVTVFMILITAFQILLHRYGNATDLLVGFPIANRRHRDTAGVVGFFVNTVVLRTDFSTSMSFRELLLKTRDACIGAYVHQDLPFDKLIEELRPPRDGSHNPVFQAMFVQQVAENSFVRVQDIVLEPVEIDTRTSKFDLTISLGERHKRLAGFIEYSTDLFNRDTIERMAEHYQTILEAIIADRDQSIATLPILTKAERHRILVEWNDTAADYPKDKCIHQLFEEQVERTPEAIAVEFENQQITYGDLNRRANQLAHYLISLGIGPEKLVGICLERSIQMVVGLLAILKAGGAYVPLDPADPDERLRIMMENARVSLWLTEDIVARRRSTIEDGPPLFSILDSRLQVVCLDRVWQLINRQNNNNTNVAVSSNNLAYVIFTSGSTGQPKGVQVSHRSVGNCLCAARNQVPITNGDIWYALTTIAFDIAGLEFYLPLTIGARIILGTREESLDGKLMSLRLRQSGATAMQATPSTWRLLLEAGWEGSDGFRILCGGEAMPHDLAEALLVRGAVWNLYGPTESTIWSMVHKVDSAERPVPIGRPLANTKIYILDCQLQPVPIGIHGDLYIGGDGLARGYWSNPRLTAEAFIPNPFSDDTSTRLYRTGDRARYRPDGVIEFLGRTDNQVKIRGYRIELGEIENTLNQYSSVKDSVVAYRERDSSEGKELIAYVVTGELSAPSVSRLRRFLQKKLPEYMIPTSFVFLNALPITANGKVDRNALPPPDGDRPRLDQRFVEPRTEIEELVAQIWREVLILDNIGIHDNFFELGGHSLLAVRVVSRLREGFNVELPLRDFFQMPTVAELVHRIEISRQSSPMSLPSLRRVRREGPILPSIVQEPILTLARSFPGLNQFNIPAVYRLSGPLDVTALKASLTGVIERHEALRTIFLVESEKRYQCIDKSPSAYLDIIDLYELPATEREAEARELYREESQRPFDLTLGPLFRVKLFRLSDDNHILAITVHHVISDGWSMMLFVRDLAELYSASVNRSQPCLPDLPIQYADFAAWQRMVLQEGLLEGQLSYWKTQLSEPMTPLQFSVGISRTDEVSFFTGRKRISISGQLFHLIKSLARQERTTPFVLLLAALSILLSRHLDQEDIRVATLSANRNRSEVENVVGHFVNTLILRTRIVKQFTFRELVKLVKDITVLAYSHQDLPFEALLQNLESETKIGFDALAPVLFTFSSELNTVEMTRLTISVADDFQSTEFEVAVTMFDLVLSLKERSEELTGFMIYKMFVFDEMMVERFIRNYTSLLETIVHDPNESVSDLCSSLEL